MVQTENWERHAASRPGASSSLVDGYFVAQHRRPAELSDVDTGALSPVLRGVLTSDGTVTTLIAACTMQPLALRVLDERTVGLPAGTGTWLEAPPGAPATRRRVEITVRATRAPVYHAETFLLRERLPPEVAGSLSTEPLGLGGALRRHGANARRELLWYGQGGPPQWTQPPRLRAEASLPGGSTLHRTYRLMTPGGQPAALITESFGLA
ncbi:chorismate--pyruvate lyase family protein [Streptomyces naphthomycinicus]|uniref:chorismate--pyruvate lyase family protein n=1 Tax=Streptomyces naphthomycinicus TaxID=2872625 RepID=UPI001CECD943|nr:chorismate pyruvate-lyase family protein [Streptomyces sp. TML10]